MERACGLQEKLGPILLVSSHVAHQCRLQLFLNCSKPTRKYTFEFRHQSWLIPQVYELLSNAGAAPASEPGAAGLLPDRPWTYIRMHRGRWGSYSDEELSTWAARFTGSLLKGLTCSCT